MRYTNGAMSTYIWLRTPFVIAYCHVLGQLKEFYQCAIHLVLHVSSANKLRDIAFTIARPDIDGARLPALAHIHT